MQPTPLQQEEDAAREQQLILRLAQEMRDLEAVLVRVAAARGSLAVAFDEPHTVGADSARLTVTARLVGLAAEHADLRLRIQQPETIHTQQGLWHSQGTIQCLHNGKQIHELRFRSDEAEWYLDAALLLLLRYDEE